MASTSEDENVQQGRRTRSGRKTSAPAPVAPTTRSTRRTSKKLQNAFDEIPENEQGLEHILENEPVPQMETEHNVEDDAEQIVSIPDDEEKNGSEIENPDVQLDEELAVPDQADGDVDGQEEANNAIEDLENASGEVENNTEETENINEHDEKSSSFPFGDNPSEVTSTLFEQSSADKEDNSFFANLAAEENANSLPSATDETRDDSVQEIENVEMGENDDDTNDDVKIVEMGDNADEMITEITEDKVDEIALLADGVVVDEVNENTVASDDNAIMEELPNGANTDATELDPDTEMVSEDELPTPPTKPKVQGTEEVSDEELPGPKLAELPADTEVVSEDELPASTKKDSSKRKAEDYDPNSPTETPELPEKKAKTEEEIVVPEPEVEKKKKLPDLDRYWKAVNDDPADFTGWTYLLQYVDQENDIEAARDAYDAFLAHYPYCYGYWRKYADYEKRKGNKKKCEEVFERGLKAIPLSVDLWIHYLIYVKTNYVDDENFIRTQFERAIDACGLEFRSDKLWEAYIKWESDRKRWLKVVDIYDRLLATPTQGYNNHFDNFSEVVNVNPVPALISTEEIKRLRTEVRESLAPKEKPVKEKLIKEEAKENPIVPVPEDEVKLKLESIKEEVIDEENLTKIKKEDASDEADVNVKLDVPEEPEPEPEADDYLKDEEISAVKDKILSIRRKLHKQTITAVTERWTFEEGIKRPYFHVKPLERCQLKNWKEYLDFEIEKGERKRILVLFERCLIACALYDEFWLKLIRYLESQNDPILETITRDAFVRACTVHHPDKPSLHLMWSAFEELNNDFDKAAEILTNIEKTCSNLLQIAYRRINVERRRKDYEKCMEYYEHYINHAKTKIIASSLAIKYARFMHKIKGDIEGGLQVLKTALEKDPSNARVVLQMIDLALQRDVVNEDEVVSMMDQFMAREGMEPDQKVLFAQRKVEFLEDFGSTTKGLQDAQRALQVALSKATEAKKKQNETTTTTVSTTAKKATKETNPPLPQPASSNTANYSSAYPYGNSQNSNYYYGNNQSAGYQSYCDYGSSSWGQQYAQGGGYQWNYGNYY